MEEFRRNLQSLVERETAMMDLETRILQLEADVKTAKTRVRDAKTELNRQEQTAALTDLQERLKAALTEQTKEEDEIVRLRQARKAFLARLKAEENETKRDGGDGDNLYDIPTNAKSTVMQGSSVSAIPEYSGVFGSDAEAFVKLVDRAKDQYKWESRATALMVRSKLTGAARLFVDNQEKELLPGIDNWDEDIAGGHNLRTQLLSKFTIPTSAVAETNAIEDLSLIHI